MSDTLLISFYIFLLIFFATAILTLLSLVNVVKISPNYQKQLFRVLILEVIGVVITFVATGLKKDQMQVAESILLDNGGHWDWNTPENSWRTKCSFSKDSTGNLQFEGATFQGPEGKTVQVIDWKSTEPINLSDRIEVLKFRAAMKWRSEILEYKPDMINEINKWKFGKIELTANYSLIGNFKEDGAASQWGIVLAHSPP